MNESNPVSSELERIAKGFVEAAWHKVNKRIISFDSFEEALKPIILSALALQVEQQAQKIAALKEYPRKLVRAIHELADLLGVKGCETNEVLENLKSFALQVEKEKKSLGSETPLPLGLTSEETGKARCPFCERPTVPTRIGGNVVLQCSNDDCRIAANPIALNDKEKIKPVEELATLGAYPLALSFDTKEERDQFVNILEEVRRVPPLQPTSSTQPTEGRASAEKKLLEEICEILKCPKDAEALLSAVRQRLPNIDTQRLRIAWEAGAKLGHGYADNFMYFTGEQKERQWRKFLEGFEAIDKAMALTQRVEGKD